MKKGNPWFWICVVVIAITGMGVMFYMTPDGIGLVNDSVAYVGGARSIMDGSGYSRVTGDGSTRAITNYPPFFSIMLAGVGVFNIDPILGARLLNIFLFGLNIVLMGILVRNASKSFGWGLVGAFLLSITDPMLQAHAFAMSEPLYLFLTMAVLLSVLAHFKKRNWGWAAAAGFIASLALLTRYVGLSLYLTAMASFIVLPYAKQINFFDWRYRLKCAVIFLVSGAPLVLTWVVRNMIVSDNAANRLLVFHPVPADNILEGLLNFWGWLLPEVGGIVGRYIGAWGILLIIGLIFLISWVVLTVVRYWKGRKVFPVEGKPATWLVATHGILYFVVLLASMTFLDASPIFENRILSPLYLCLIVLFVVLAAWLWRKKHWFPRVASLILTGMLLLSFIEDSMDTIRDFHKEGQGFSGSAWQNSETMQAIKELPSGIFIFSNRSSAIYLLTNKPAYILPTPINPATMQPREGYEEDVQLIRGLVATGKAVIIFFNYQEILADPDSMGWLNDLTNGMQLIKQYSDGAIFGATGNE